MSERPHVPVHQYDGYIDLGEKLWLEVGRPVGMPHLEDADVKLLDEAISILNPPEAHVRVVEVDTFMESESSIVKGGVPIGHGDYSLRQMTVILKRAPSTAQGGAEDAALTPAGEESKAKEEGGGEGPGPDVEEEAPVDEAGMTEAQKAAKARVEEREAMELEEARRRAHTKLPEIILFWARSMRRGGNLVVCPNEQSMNRLIRAYLVCEVVQDSKLFDKSMTSFRERLTRERKGALMGVELGEVSPAEQDTLENLISEYSFHDASIGIVSLALSIYYFLVLGRNDVNVLTLLAVAVVAGLNQEATWPWVFKHILLCARMKDPIVRVTQCRQVRHHQGQLSGQGFLAIGLAVFGVYLEVWPADDGHTPWLFRILLNGFQAVMLAVLVINMVQAVEPMSLQPASPKDRLYPWARTYLDDNVFDTEWYLTLIVGALWAGIIAVVVTQLPYDSELERDVAITCAVVLALSLASVNPGVALMSIWGILWLIPVGLAFVLRSAFDTTLMLINKVTLTWRRMANEVMAHVRRRAFGKFSVQDTLILLLQVLPLAPMLIVSLPVPLLYILVWFIHISMRVFLRVADAMISPLSGFRLYPILSDYGSVTWKMERLTMDVENRSMRALLLNRIEKLLGETGGDRFKTENLPFKPYWHLSKCPRTRLGCISFETSTEKCPEKSIEEPTEKPPEESERKEEGEVSKVLLVSPITARNHTPPEHIASEIPTTRCSMGDADPETVTYGSNAPGDERSRSEKLVASLGSTLWEQFGCLDLPRLRPHDLDLLDKAISQLRPQQVRVRVVEVDTFTESERTIAKGGVPLHLAHGTYSLKQKTVILKRISPDSPPSDATRANARPAMSAAAGEEDAQQQPVASAGSSSEMEPPEIVLFWGRNMRQGGNLAVCPSAESVVRLIQAYLVCEVVYDSERENWLKKQAHLAKAEFCLGEERGALMGVELAEATPAEQRDLEKLISDYSFNDASIGVISLVASIYIFGVLGRNDVRILTLISIGVVGGLHQEATWPWVFKHVLRCSRITDKIARVSRCRQAHYHQGQLSGKALLATGHAAFAVYLEIVPAADGETPILFRFLLCTFQAIMIAVLLVNMVQAVEPVANRERLHPWVRPYLNHNVFDESRCLALSVMLAWGVVVAAVVTQLPYDSELGWSVAITCLVILGMSLASVNPGVALMSVLGISWLIPAGLALVFRSVFDAGLMLTNKLALARRRMTREIGHHVTVKERNACGILAEVLPLLLRVLPLIPLFVVSLPIRVLYFVMWFVHLWMSIFSRVADLMLCPISPFRLQPILGDYGSVAWRMGRHRMDIEQEPMTKLLREKVDEMKKDGLFHGGVIPHHPYSHLGCKFLAHPAPKPECVPPRLGCIAIVPRDEHEHEQERALFVNSDLVLRGMKAEGSGVTGGGNGPPKAPDGSTGPAVFC
eukprot:g7979.t1